MPEMAARPLHLCLPLQKIPREARLLQEAHMWTRFESYRSGKAEGAGYALPTANPFGSWDVSDRYAHQSNFDEARAQGHQAGAQSVRSLIAKAQREGLL